MTPLPQTTSQAAVEELAKQRMLVTYLRDSVSFPKTVSVIVIVSR